ncbi:MAG: hypothetical protein ACKO7R_13255 [Pseudanabaena sp.]
MSLKASSNHGSQPKRQLPLRSLLIVPFALQISAAVGLTGYLSLQNGQKAVNELATQLRYEVNNRIDQHLDSYMATPRQVSQTVVDAIDLKLIDPENLEDLGRFFWKQMQFHEVGYIAFGMATGEYVASGICIEEDGTTCNMTGFSNLSNIVIERISPRIYDNTNVYAYYVDSQGQRTEELTDPPTPYDFQSELWYKSQVGKPLWTAVFNWDSPPIH